nr:hypothetical protein [uncultured Methanobrevibacter sp.]
MRKIFLIILFLFLTVSAVSAGENSTGIISSSDFNGSSLETQNIELQAVDNSNSSHECALSQNENLIEKSSDGTNLVSKFSAKDVTSRYGLKTTFSVKLLSKNGKPLKDKSVTFNINGKQYVANSNSKGVASVSFKLDAGKYKINYFSDGIAGKIQ